MAHRAGLIRHGAGCGAFYLAVRTPVVSTAVSSAVTGTTHHFNSVLELQKEVEWARIYAGFHYHHSLVQGFALGHKVAHNVANNYFQPVK
jgi:hypothetical protein